MSGRLRLPDLKVPTSAAIQALEILEMKGKNKSQRATSIMNAGDSVQKRALGNVADEAGWTADWAYDDNLRVKRKPFPANYFPERNGYLLYHGLENFCIWVLTWYFDREWTEEDLIALKVAHRMEHGTP